MDKKKAIFFPLLLVLLSLRPASAQAPYEELPSISIGIGYFGELATRPGVVVFGEMALTKGKNQLATRLNLAYYRHRGHTRNWLLLPEFLFRRNTKKRNIWEVAIGAGTLRQRADSRVLEYQQGEFVERRSGWFHFTPSLGFRYGRNITLANDNLLAPSIGGRFFYQYPFNDFWLPKVAIDLSVAYQLR